MTQTQAVRRRRNSPGSGVPGSNLGMPDHFSNSEQYRKSSRHVFDAGRGHLALENGVRRRVSINPELLYTAERVMVPDPTRLKPEANS